MKHMYVREEGGRTRKAERLEGGVVVELFEQLNDLAFAQRRQNIVIWKRIYHHQTF